MPPYQPSADWQYEIPTTGSKRLPPAARYVESLTHQGYGFEAAIADLIDNSIDAGARNVVVSFLRDDDRLAGLLVVDDGCGMNDEALDTAMTVGGREGYAASALGHFGAGLKAASLSHADSLTVISRTKKSPSTGRRWLTARAHADFTCDVVDPRYCQDLVDRYDGIVEWHGTIVRWDRVRAFDTVTAGQADRFLNDAIEKLETHLGLYLHRFLAREDFNIDIVVEDVRTKEELDHRGVEPIDPFGYRIPGRVGYPVRTPHPWRVSERWLSPPTSGRRSRRWSASVASVRSPNARASTSIETTASSRQVAGTAPAAPRDTSRWPGSPSTCRPNPTTSSASR